MHQDWLEQALTTHQFMHTHARIILVSTVINGILEIIYFK